MQKRKSKPSATGGDKGWDADTRTGGQTRNKLSGSRQHAKAPTRLAGFVMGAAKGVGPIRHTHPARRGGGKGGCLLSACVAAPAAGRCSRMRRSRQSRQPDRRDVVCPLGDSPVGGKVYGGVR
ncbi:uncharacterized protein L203_103439 [Cryptococcus depauperatus CBS 7841]|uniref:Uncharacterized protein n=1 Tax=Cryptococcus depauperatus CBS 7841 TaxID=1295531 RepID=A0AAJ8JTP4_9TREE